MSPEAPVPSQLGTSDRPSDAPPPKPSVPETPRKRKPPVQSRLPGIRTTLPNNLTLPSIRKRLKKRLKLTYTPDDWQLHLIRRLLQGYDSILCAGTGYGKSLIFEGLAALGGKGKCVVIISPLKALEHDQATQAISKGLDAVVLNEDTTQTRGVWEQAKKHACLIYASPEMALAPSFQKLWRDAKFRGRLLAVVIDEAHCVEEWGDDSFRPAYRRLSTLRHYTGQDVPFLACTATCSTSTFKTLWDTLSFGSRPFWGLDVGVERNNLLYSIRELVNTKNPVLDVLNILPRTIDHNTTAQNIPKCLFYFSSENDCQLGVRFLRNCLPASIRQSVQAFSSTLSEGAKAQAWDAFLDGRIRILCATDAAGMGCNVPDVQYVVSFGIPKTVGQVCQRWGRGGRDRTTQAVCILLVPAWSIRPDAQLLTNPLLARLKGGPKPEPKSHTVRRAKLDTRVEHAINLKYDRPRGCVHRFFASTFRPATNLHEFRSLDAKAPSICGAISESSPYELSWTVLDLGRKPPPSRCCHLCNASELDAYRACDLDDPRLKTFAHQFLYPLAIPATPENPPRPSSSASDRSDMSTLSTDSASTHNTNTTSDLPTASKIEVSVAEMVRLESLLVAWRKDEHERQGASVYLSAGIYLPPRQVGILADAAENFANMAKITVSSIRKLVRLDMLNDDQVSSLSIAISNWKRDLPSVTEIARTPKSQQEQQMIRTSSAELLLCLKLQNSLHVKPLELQDRTTGRIMFQHHPLAHNTIGHAHRPPLRHHLAHVHLAR
ncbi:hypothetical protein D9611_007435 [Ephemerocybe angulata]|uniref:DNA 3'-5' helicase n=1 Tax=Ephemerocybe angulata TaxID=980116 RepID=A0A8H5CG92_9AGAR|nr:hypothetical protein D9611_007435 [Tulosesus angulatus]